MQKIPSVFKTFLDDEDGTTAVEYGLMIALIAVVIIVAVKQFGLNTSNLWANNLANILAA